MSGYIETCLHEYGPPDPTCPVCKRRAEWKEHVRQVFKDIPTEHPWRRGPRTPPSQTAAATDNAPVTPGDESPCEISESERGARTGGRR